ncbi:MAG: HYR domain-containing protein [Chloroflexota bacterium]
MSPVGVRRAAALGLVLALSVSAIATADTIVADGDAVSGAQPAVHLGDVAPGQVVPLDVAFELTCEGASRVVAGTSIAVTLLDKTEPSDGSATVEDGRVDVPGTWPAPGTDCPAGGLSIVAGTPARLVLTAPTTVATDLEFVFLFLADPGTGVTNNIVFTATVNVVEAPHPDTTAPVLSGMPADVTVSTAGSSAIVTWTDPVATDDTDPSPVVACDPASGSSFPLGTSTVRCTATDASGNAASATFQVTVWQLPTGATWGSPLDTGAVPALVGQLGRTVPLKLHGLAGGEAPSLVAERLEACAADSPARETRPAGTFDWTDGAWRLQLRTGDLGAGCWRLVATRAGVPVATAVVLLVPDAAAKEPARRR